MNHLNLLEKLSAPTGVAELGLGVIVVASLLVYLASDTPQLRRIRLCCGNALFEILYLRLKLTLTLRIIFLKQRQQICKAGNRALIALALFIERDSLLAKALGVPIGWYFCVHDWVRGWLTPNDPKLSHSRPTATPADTTRSGTPAPLRNGETGPQRVR